MTPIGTTWPVCREGFWRLAWHFRRPSRELICLLFVVDWLRLLGWLRASLEGPRLTCLAQVLDSRAWHFAAQESAPSLQLDQIEIGVMPVDAPLPPPPLPSALRMSKTSLKTLQEVLWGGRHGKTVGIP